MTSYEPQPEAMASYDYFESARVVEANGYPILAEKLYAKGQDLELQEAKRRAGLTETWGLK